MQDASATKHSTCMGSSDGAIRSTEAITSAGAPIVQPSTRQNLGHFVKGDETHCSVTFVCLRRGPEVIIRPFDINHANHLPNMAICR